VKWSGAWAHSATRRVGQAVISILDEGSAALEWAKSAEAFGDLAGKAGALGAVLSAKDLVEAVNKGDGVAAFDAGYQLGSEAIGRLGGPVGAAFDTGTAVGTTIGEGLEFFSWGKRVNRWIGEKVVNALGIEVDYGAQK
jgi:hypothetical protein